MIRLLKPAILFGLLGLFLRVYTVPAASELAAPSLAPGQLAFISAYSGPDALNSIKDLVASPASRFVYAISPFSNSLTVLAVDQQTGALTEIQRIQDDGSGAAGLLFPLAIEISHDGTGLAVSAFGNSGQQLTVFERNAATGRLRHIQNVLISGEIGAFLFAPEGQHVYTTSWTGGSPDYVNQITIHDRDPLNGLLSNARMVPIASVVAFPVESLVIDGSGSFLYSDHFAVFERSWPEGDLNLQLPLSGYRGEKPLVIGTEIYAVHPAEDRLSVFDAIGVPGALALAHSYQDGLGSGEGLEGACDIAAKGGAVLVLGCAEDRLLYYRHGTGGGALYPLQSLLDGLAGVTGMQNPAAIFWPAAAGWIFVAGRASDSIAVFRWQNFDNSVYLPIGATK